VLNDVRKKLFIGFKQTKESRRRPSFSIKEKERKRSDYRKVVEADHAEIKKGNYNFKGIGLTAEEGEEK